ncbi:PAS domain-containing sensor histidine kinase [Legionella maioricensis]|uniref:histidine kinase n=1 Tax=Legionella maioricensis TaxID=2896528 RepID=A0A9X2D2N9_9GAMM|nr:PAS domain-containing sensor histidine kinase [Legionella maioricensis]MCL9685540.1 PAS domain-containing protein [Legionella maioricensis]MCL9688900.1 ATP-binding protein [Legionella maioricensis]
MRDRETLLKRQCSELNTHAEILTQSIPSFEISYDHLMELLDTGKLNVWEWDLITNEVIDFGYSGSLSILDEYKDVGNIEHFITRLHPDDREHIERKLTNALVNFEDYSAEFRIQFIEGSYEWVLARGRYIRDADKNPIKMIGTWRFITEQKNTQELIQLQQTTLNRLSRCYFLGEVASSLSHEISQPLCALNTFLTGSILRLQHDGIEKKEFANILQTAAKQVDLISTIIKRIKRFVTHGELHFESVNIALLANNAVKMAKFYSNFPVTIKYDFDERLTETNLDRNQIKQVFLNIINNAFEAMFEACTSHPTLFIQIEQADSWIVVRIIDNGPGIPNNVIDNLFTSAYSSKEYGLGVGLSICRKIIQAHGGSINIARNLSGEGTVCSFKLPYRRSNHE